jgi:hypothetical protein
MRADAATAGDTLLCSHDRSLACTSCACAGVATLPVPMAHTGSYATTTLVQSLTARAYACARARARARKSGRARHYFFFSFFLFVLERQRRRPPPHRELAGDDVHGAARLALGGRLAQAGDDRQAVVNGGRGLGRNALVGLALLPALRVAEDGVLEPQVLEHRRRHLARVRARRRVRVLRRHRKVAAQARLDLRRARVGRAGGRAGCVARAARAPAAARARRRRRAPRTGRGTAAQ